MENHGGRTASMTTPNPTAQTELLVEAYGKAGVNPATVGYIEAHGTGTRLGDPIEINSLKSAFKRLYAESGEAPPATPHCGLGSVKTNIGHLETAAGIAGLIKVALCLRNRWLPATLHVEAVNPYIQLEGSPFYLCRQGRAWDAPRESSGQALPRRAGISSFGFGGSNAHVVLEEYAGHTGSVGPGGGRDEPQARLIVLSARKEDRLRELAAQLAGFLSRRQASLREVAYTLQTGREALEERAAFVAASLEELAEKLAAFGEGRDDFAHLYRGNAKSGRRALEALTAGKAGEAFLRMVAEDRDWDRLARLWVAGAEIDFGRLYEGARPRRVHLPTYPFARERYWLPQGRAAAAVEAVAHPLVGRRTPGDQHGYELRLSGEEFYLADHVIGGRKTLPAVVYIEMARAAGERAMGRPVGRLSEMVWMRPLTVDGQPRDVRIRLLPAGDALSFEVSAESPDGDAVVHSQGKALAGDGGGDAWLDLATIRQRATETWSAENCYARFDANGFTGGPSFRAIRELFRNQGEALARLELPASVDDGAAWVLHPSLLDGALESVIGLLGDCRGIPWLPFALGELHIAGALPRACYAYVRRAEGGQEASFDIQVSDAGGRVLVDIRRLDFRPLETAPERPETMYFKPARQARQVAGQAAAPGGHRVLLCGAPLQARFACETIMAPGLDAVGYRRLFENLKREGRRPSHIVYMAPQGVSVESLFGFLDAVRECGSGELQVLYCYRESSGEPQADLAAFGAAGRTLAAENPNILWRTLSAPDLSVLEEALPGELDAREDVVFDAQGGRWVSEWKRLAGIPRDGAAPPLRPQGVYILTGGAGGLGMLVARHLAETWRARLVLCGRTAEDRAIAEQVAELNALGGEAVYVRCDVANRASVFDLIGAAKARFGGGVHGIIHCAGVVADALVGRKTPEEIRMVLAPKVDGARHLDEATERENLDFLMFFSSAAAAVGNAGQSDYAYANSFLDHFAEWREGLRQQGRRAGKTISINWPLWRDGGMTVALEVETLLRQTKGVVPLPAAEGVRIFEQALGSGLTRLMVIAGYPSKIARLVGGTGQARPAARPAATGAALTRDIGKMFRNDFLADVLAVLQLESSAIGLDDDLADYGF
ncbi:MAG TPA: SDR family NAD(P)-dependent oxidoreductase, partial [Opitutaceae bacterium]|nr:SDR family NAD(P)-dependent oxidoreductase [Opitutaceae bacterium]